MKYLSVSQIAKKWNVSDRTVRNYCAKGRISGVFLTGKTWNIPEDSIRPSRINEKSDKPKNLLEFLKVEKDTGIKGGIYHKIQVDLTYNSNHIEGSKLTNEETRFIYETNTIGNENGEVLNVDDIIETVNHFRCIDLIIDKASHAITESLIKELHKTLKTGTSDSRKSWFAVGDYKKYPNEVANRDTTSPEEVEKEMRKLLKSYNAKKEKTLEDILDFHYKFERIHPFQDGNGRVGRLLMFKECLRNDIVPFIIDEEHKLFYYRGLSLWEKEPEYLKDTCLSAQDNFKESLKYFRIPYRD